MKTCILDSLEGKMKNIGQQKNFVLKNWIPSGELKRGEASLT